MYSCIKSFMDNDKENGLLLLDRSFRIKIEISDLYHYECQFDVA